MSTPKTLKNIRKPNATAILIIFMTNQAECFITPQILIQVL